MKIQTETDLIDAIARELSWRKKELTAFKLSLPVMRQHERASWIRAAVCILYSHWEGFVREAATYYLNYVAQRRPTHDILSPGLLALVIRERFRAYRQSDKISLHIEIVDFFRSGLATSSRIPWKDGVDTQSNLNSEVFREIAHLIGLDYSRYSTKEAIIDEKLLKSRNGIAHGENVSLGLLDYEELHADVLELIEWFRDDVENAVAQKNYRLVSAPKSVI
jgi:hypothetical protein